MARPPKIGLDYFPFNVTLPTDSKVKFLRARFGLKGYAIYTILLCKIYQDKGYYCDWNEDEALLFANDVGDGVTMALVNDVVHECFKRGLLNEGIFNEFKILTSKGIQDRYEYICSILKRPVRIDPKIDCRNLTLLKLALTPEKTELSPVETTETTPDNSQRKGKEIKEKESENTHAAFLKQLFADSEKLKAVAFIVREETLKQRWVEAFNAYLQTQSKTHPSYRDWVSHLGNWLPKAITELKKSDNTTGGTTPKTRSWN